MPSPTHPTKEIDAEIARAASLGWRIALASVTYSFSLVLEGPNPNDPENLDRLFEAGCADATFAERDGVFIAEFDREASSFANAVISAIGTIERSVTGLRVSRVEPEELVTASDIAARTHRSRESIRQLFEGTRGSGDFPRPCAWLANSTRLWRWNDVAIWFARDDKGAAKCIDFIASANALLTLRRTAERSTGNEDHAIRDLRKVLGPHR